MEGREMSHMNNTMKLEMIGIMSPDVCLHHFQLQTWNMYDFCCTECILVQI